MQQIIVKGITGILDSLLCSNLDSVNKLQPLAKIINNNKEEFILSPEEGIIKEIRNKKGDQLSPLKTVFIIESQCKHPQDFNNICTFCGENLLYKIRNNERITVNISHTTNKLREQVNIVEEKALKHKDNLLNNKKLIMLLDLDLTVIHAVSNNDITIISEKQEKYPKNLQDIHHFTILNVDFWVQVRPYTFEFIKEMSKLFEIHVYTAGERSYANHIINILDPDNSIFNGRVLTKTESPNTHFKFVKRLFPFSSEIVIIVDDSPKAWSADIGKNQMFKIRPFIFFLINKTNPDDMNKEVEKDGKIIFPWLNINAKKDKELEYCKNFLTTIHNNFFLSLPKSPNISIEQILSEKRSSLLKGVCVLFSSIYPSTTIEVETSFWKIVLAFGGTCVHEYNNNVTHILCAKKNTKKYHWGIQEKKYVLSIFWLVDCVRHWERPIESNYILDKLGECNTKKLQAIDKEFYDALICYPILKNSISESLLEELLDESDEDSSEDDTSDDNTDTSSPPKKRLKVY